MFILVSNYCNLFLEVYCQLYVVSKLELLVHSWIDMFHCSTSFVFMYSSFEIIVFLYLCSQREKSSDKVMIAT